MIIQAWKDILDGVECAYWDHSVETAICYLEFALRLDMIATVGGDHHGGFRERVGQIGPRLAALGDHWERFNYQRLLEPRS